MSWLWAWLAPVCLPGHSLVSPGRCPGPRKVKAHPNLSQMYGVKNVPYTWSQARVSLSVNTYRELGMSKRRALPPAICLDYLPGKKDRLCLLDRITSTKQGMGHLNRASRG